MLKEYVSIICVTFPFLINSLGSFFVYFVPKRIDGGVISGFTAGVMASACIWSLIVPSIKLSLPFGGLAFLPVCGGIVAGIFIIFISQLLLKKCSKEFKLKKLFWAITLHNIPEGLAVGFAVGAGGEFLYNALAVSFGIGLQNFPEGLALSLAYKKAGKSNMKSFAYGIISGIAEPISALIGLLLVNYLSFLQPLILAFSAGVMIFVIVDELIPESVTSKRGVVGFLIGFLLMTALDLLLG